MKGQAFVTFPTVELAQRALDETHGYVFHEKPMIIVRKHCQPYGTKTF
jgi:U11/U12 small nuclear ribonucleoprotein SNRNP65